MAALAVGLLCYIASWYRKTLSTNSNHPKKGKASAKGSNKPVSKKAWFTLFLILFFIFARSSYISGMTNFYSLFTIDQYSLTIKESQLFLFTFLVSGAIGTFFGGPLADRFGKKNIIFISMIGSAPLTILIPLTSSTIAFWLLAMTGFLLMTSFSVTVVYAQELFPGKIGTMAGLTVGFAFGMGALASAGLGFLADQIGLKFMITFIGFLPLLGALSFFLPSDKKLAENECINCR